MSEQAWQILANAYSSRPDENGRSVGKGLRDPDGYFRKNCAIFDPAFQTSINAINAALEISRNEK